MIKKLLIVTSANTEKGLSEVSRVNSLLEQFSKCGIGFTIMTDDQIGKKYFKKNKISYIETNFEADQKQVCEEIKKQYAGHQGLLLTSYDYLECVRELVNPDKLFLITDHLEETKTEVDLHICSMAITDQGNQIKNQYLGPKYHFVKDNIRGLSTHQVRDEIKNVLLTMGGADSKELTVGMMGTLFHHASEINYTVLLGAAMNRAGFVEKRVLGISDDIKVLRNLHDLESHYSQFDLAVCKAGVSMYEMMYLGIPLMVVATDISQVPLLEDLAAKKCILFLGYYEDLSEDKLKTTFQLMLKDPELLKMLSINAKKVIDGQGILRVLEEFVRVF